MINENYPLLEKQLSYEFKNKSLLKQALTHRSYAPIHNERLEFLGDAILGAVIAQELYQRYPKFTEGELTRARAYLVKKETLACLAQQLGISEFLCLGSGEKRSGGYQRPSILADAVEAIIGAIYLDQGLEQCTTVLQQWYRDELLNLQDPMNLLKDSKTKLQEVLQKKSLALPEYTLLDEVGACHDKTFYIQCTVLSPNIVVEAQASSRRIAEQKAAALALTQLEEVL